MNADIKPVYHSEQKPARPRSIRLGRVIGGVLALAGILALVAGVMVFREQIPLLPRSTRRGLTEGLLRAVLIGYGGLLIMSVVALPIMAALLRRSRGSGRARPFLMRATLAGFLCFFSLALLEAGSAAWRAWMHRFPKLPTTFSAGDPDEYRIVVLGGSSALGEPYRPWLSVGQIIAWRLGEAMPKRRFECEILAWLGDSLEDQHVKLASITRRPNMVIIYSGHNEYAARYEEEREGWLDEEPRHWLLRPIYAISVYSPFCRLAFEVISKNRLDEGPPLHGRHRLIDPPQCSPAEAEEIRADFDRRLEALTTYSEQIGALPVLIIPPANEADYEPSRSTLPASVPQEERTALEREMADSRSRETTEADASAETYRRVLGRFPTFAEAHYRLARLYEKVGKLGDAARHYEAALDHDGLLIRCPEPIRAAYDRVARRHPRAILIDGRTELAAVSPRKLLDDRVIQDTHHPTLLGYVTLAQTVLRELARRKTFGAGYSGEGALKWRECANHFGMDVDIWAKICDRTSDHYQRVAGYRFDPTDRLEKSRRYAEAARRIRSGVDVEKAGMPWLGGEGAVPGRQ